MEPIPSNSDPQFLVEASRVDHQATPSRSVRPAQGERRAVGGFHAQHRVSASLLYRSLRDNSLRWIRVADPDAGRVDDLQIGGNSRVDAYQVKSSHYGGNFSFNEFSREPNGESSLNGELARGRRLLKSARPGHRIVVHLITNQTPSNADNLPSGSDIPCLLYCGEADGFFPGAKDASQIIPNARFASFPGLNHGQTSRAAEAVLPHVTEFLREVSQKVGAGR